MNASRCTVTSRQVTGRCSFVSTVRVSSRELGDNAVVAGGCKRESPGRSRDVLLLQGFAKGNLGRFSED